MEAAHAPRVQTDFAARAADLAAADDRGARDLGAFHRGAERGQLLGLAEALRDVRQLSRGADDFPDAALLLEQRADYGAGRGGVDCACGHGGFRAGHLPVPWQFHAVCDVCRGQLRAGSGVDDSSAGPVVAAWSTGFCALFLRNFIKQLPFELVEAARIEGANEWTVFFKIVLPLIRPALAALAILVFTFVWNDYFWALCLTQGDDAAPITVGVAALKGQWTTAWNLVSAGSILAALPSVAMFFAMQKHFVAGLTFGATKG
ncbi:hypothetical protein KCU90_g3170, partial [Aureobasidium melanogenum]